MAKRYYWLKLKDDFFDSLRIKKLRRVAGGDTYTIIYLKMQLKAMKHDGIIEYSGIENTLAEEIALDIDEDAENVGLTLNYLQATGLCEVNGEDIFLPYAVENVGSETSSAQRMRDARSSQRNIPEHCGTLCAHSDGEKEKRDREDIESRGEVEQPSVQSYEQIVSRWNSIPHTIDIDSIIPCTRREDELRVCISMYGYDRVLEAVDKVKGSRYLCKRGNVCWDSYMNRNAMQKLLEGGYDTDYKSQAVSKFNDFPQRDYDFAALEAKLYK